MLVVLVLWVMRRMLEQCGQTFLGEPPEQAVLG